MADWIFDGPNKIITEPAGSGDTTFNVAQDIYSAAKRWVITGVGAKFDFPFSVEGGTPIGATGLFTGTTFILINGWKLRAASHDHQATLVGNLYSDDGIVSVSTPGFSTNIFISATVGAQGIASGSGLDSSQATQLLEMWKLLGLDAVNPVTHTPTSTSVDDVTITHTGDQSTSITSTRS